MTVPINSLDLRFAAVEAVRAARAVERRTGDKADAVTADQQGEGKSRGFLRQQYESEQDALARLAPLRANLQPSDEVAIFGNPENTAPTTFSYDEKGAITVTSKGEAVDDNGKKVAVDIITPQELTFDAEKADAKIVELQQRTQSNVAKVYARNNDIVFSTQPATQLAA